MREEVSAGRKIVTGFWKAARNGTAGGEAGHEDTQWSTEKKVSVTMMTIDMIGASMVDIVIVSVST